MGGSCHRRVQQQRPVTHCKEDVDAAKRFIQYSPSGRTLYSSISISDAWCIVHVLLGW